MIWELSRERKVKMRIIPNWQKKNLRCHFCGETRSVKYEIEVFDPVISDKPTFVCVCNRFALHYDMKKEDEWE